MLSNTINAKSNAKLGLRPVGDSYRVSDIPKDIRRGSTSRTRDELQDEALRTVLGYRRLVLNWGTGVGKSRVAVRLVDHLVGKGKDSILLLVQETAHKVNWGKEFEEVLGKDRAKAVLETVTVECYASLPKYADTVWDCIIADEAHHLRSDNRTAILSTMGARYFLCLSATLSENGDADQLVKTLEDTFGHFESLSFGVQDAINNDIIGEPAIHLHVLDIKKISRPQRVLLDWGMPWMLREEPQEVTYDEALRRLEHRGEDGYKTFRVTCTCSAEQAYDLMNRLLEARKQERDDLMESISNEKDKAARSAMCRKVTYLENAAKQAGLRRKNLLGQCKTAFAEWLLERLDERGTKYVCFCTDVEQVKALGGDNAIHSGRSGNLGVIDSFNEGAISNIFAVDMIKEGQNLNGIQAGVIVQLGGKERDFVQKLGRALRSREPEQHLIVIDHTRDVDYLKVALGNIDKKYVAVHRWPVKK